MNGVHFQSNSDEYQNGDTCRKWRFDTHHDLFKCQVWDGHFLFPLRVGVAVLKAQPWSSYSHISILGTAPRLCIFFLAITRVDLSALHVQSKRPEQQNCNRMGRDYPLILVSIVSIGRYVNANLFISSHVSGESLSY